MSTSVPEQPASGQDPQVTAPAVAPAPVVANPGPWDADLQLTFDDPNVRAKVDAFMRSKVQPRMTQLEQQLAGSRNAVALFDDLRTRTDDTFVALANEIYGEKGAEAVLTVLQDRLKEAEATAAGEPAPEHSVANAPLDPRIEQMLTDYEERRAADLYEEAMGQAISARPDINPDHLHPFVAAANGDFAVAIGMYDNYRTQLLSSAGITPEQLNTPPVAPPALGSDVGGAASSTTPVEPRKQTLDQAIEEFVRENSPRNRVAPPVMG